MRSQVLVIRAEIDARPEALGAVMSAVAAGGAEVVGVDVVGATKTTVVRDLTVQAGDEEAAVAVAEALKAMDGVKVLDVTDRVFQAHEGGKLTMRNRAALTSRDDLSMAYTPGVARVCMAIHHDFDKAWEFTIKGNSVMVVSDGSSVVGQGDLGPLASLPVCEALCMFMKELAGIDAFPLPIDAKGPAEISTHVERISSVFAGVHLADISAPACFDILTDLGARLEIPVFHGDQEGTAASLLAGLINGLKVTGKELRDARVVVCGLGPGGQATARLLVAAGVGEVLACDRRGAVHKDRADMDERLAWIAEHTNSEGLTGSVHELIRGADAFIGLSVPDLLSAADVATMAKDPIVFGLAMPNPELDPDTAGAAAVFGTGRPDLPNQINSTLAFPGIWRGAIDVRATRINDAMVMAAANAIASVVEQEGALSADYVVPSVFNKALVPAVANAVRVAAQASGVARIATVPA
jgi:malate dehydrogenase (oxaloacetate-decarboxylating)